MTDAQQALKDWIEATAQACGFALCKVTRPALAAPHAQALHAWANADMQGNMAWMTEETRTQRRLNPESMLDGVRSIISVAMAYTPAYNLDEACSASDQGVISTYAHGDDYHEIMKKRLKQLAAALDERLGKHDQRVFVDTAPVMEHALAASAGLGWQGKHSLTLHRQLGSWFLLGEIFTTAAIEADKPASNHCGSCSACMDICPTGAIVAPYVVDARLCISYLTIEYDGFIPHELRPLMGNRIYGCDDCQLICPWNHHAQRPDGLFKDASTEETPHWHDPLKPRRENHLPNLASLLHLDDDAFRQWFRKSPVKRTKRAGLLRNVCIAMGNSGSIAFVEDLLQVLNDHEALIRGHAAWALSRLAQAHNAAHIIAHVEHCLDHEHDHNAQQEMNLTIEYLRSKYELT